jgi:hypothetical protein
MDKSLIIGCALAIITVILLWKSIPYRNEYYDPQDMGGRRFWGWGKSYGYPITDMDYAPQQCYQVARNYLCREGHTRKINPVTNGDQCCVNNYVY